jgi:hypothetical protein
MAKHIGVTTYPEKVRALKLMDLSRSPEKVLHPDQLVWVNKYPLKAIC